MDIQSDEPLKINQRVLMVMIMRYTTAPNIMMNGYKIIIMIMIMVINNDDDDNDIDMDIHDSWSKQDEFMRYPQNSPKPVILTIGDIGRLRPMTYLNDSLIDFYLKYIYRELLSDSQRNDIHIFNKFFYTKLDSVINSENEKSRLKLGNGQKE